jgi:hypothetical protein
LATARTTAAQKTRNCALSCGLSPGFSRFSPVSVDIDQLLCLPEPLMPANGFSCSRQTRPYLSAVLRKDLHRQVLVIGRKIGVFENRGDFILAGGHFVVAGFDRNAELEQFKFRVSHERQHALGDRTEILVFQFLALGRRGAKQGAAGGDQIGAEK